VVFLSGQTVFLTTSRSPSPRSRTLVNALALVTPAQKIIRGKKSLRALFSECGPNSTVAVVFERFGNPAGFTLYSGGRLVETISFSGFQVSKGLKQLIDRAGVARVVAGSKTPKSHLALKLRDFLIGLPPAQGRLTSSIEVFDKGDREVVAIFLKGVQCVSFYFRLN